MKTLLNYCTHSDDICKQNFLQLFFSVYKLRYFMHPLYFTYAHRFVLFAPTVMIYATCISP